MSTEELRIAELRSRIQALRHQTTTANTPESGDPDLFAKVLQDRIQEAPQADPAPGQDLTRTVEELQTAQNSFQQMQRLHEQLLLAYHQTLPADAEDGGGQKTVTPPPDPQR